MNLLPLILSSVLSLTGSINTVYSGSFDCNSGSLPWGHHFAYESAAVQVESDYKFFVTVIYSTSDTNRRYKSQYLRQWLQMHPALCDLKQKTNFREITENDPIYRSYLREKVRPLQLPAIIVTLPADNNYMGRAVYVAYGRYLPTNPNTLALELQTTFDKYTAAYQQAQQSYTAVSTKQQCRPGQPCFPRPFQPRQYPPQYLPQPYSPQYLPRPQPSVNVELPIVRPRVRETEEDSSVKILLLLFGAIVIFFLVQKRR